MDRFMPFLSMERLQALISAAPLPDRTTGAALFADISGFSPLARTLVAEVGRKQGAEDLLRHINPVYEALIATLHEWGGSVITFVGDAIICWLDDREGPAAARALACALAMQAAVERFATARTAAGSAVPIRIKVAVAAGGARRLRLGDPALRVVEALAGATLGRMAAAEALAQPGEVVASREAVASCGPAIVIREWRGDVAVIGGNPLGVGIGQAAQASPTPWPAPPVGLPAETLRPWLLPTLYERLREGASDLGDLRPVASLMLRFSDIDIDGDDLAVEHLSAYIRWAQAVIHDHGGVLSEVIFGDKGAYLYAPFGAPTAHEDDPRRALLAALALQSPPPDLARFANPRIGINHGDVWAGICGAAARHTYAVMGSEVNLSARLMTRAEPGQILVTAALEQQAGFVFVPLGPIAYKGFAEPVPTFRLLRYVPPEAQSFAGAIVGREAELERLAAFAEPIFGGAFAGIAAIYGEPGIGKSRLVYALRERLGERAGWLRGECDQILRQPFNPFAAILRRFFGQSPERSADENRAAFLDARDRLLERLDRLPAGAGTAQDSPAAAAQREPRPPGSPTAPRAQGAAAVRDEIARTWSFLGALLGLEWPDTLAEQLEDPLLRFQNTTIAIANLLLAESYLGPLVILLEDVQWLDEMSQALLVSFARQAAGRPIVLLLTSRYADDGSRPALNLPAGLPFLAIDLDALQPAALEAIAEQLLGGPVAANIVDLLRQKTQSNPLFAQQVLYYLRENGLLRRLPSGAWTSTATAFELPASISALLVARLDRLAEHVKEVVQTAAVLGREFEVHILSKILNFNSLPLVEQAEHEQIWSMVGDLRYLFGHSLLREAAYDMQLRARLSQLHHLAGQALEALHMEQLLAYASTIAYHYETAFALGMTAIRQQAKAFICIAGENAARNYANASAIEYFSRALNLTPAADAQARFHLLLAREAVYHLTGQREEQARDLAELAELTAPGNRPLERAETAWRRARHAAGTGDYAAAIGAAEETIAYAQAAGDRNWEAAGELELGSSLWRQGQFAAAREHLERTLGLARQAGRRDLEADCLRSLGNVAFNQGEPDQAGEYFSAALNLARANGNRLIEGAALNNLGIIALGRGDYGRARAYYEQALPIRREIGDRRGEMITLINVGLVLQDCAEYAAATAVFEQALGIAREIGDRGNQAVALTNMASNAAVQGDPQAALAYQEQALAIFREIGERRGLGYALTSMSDTLVSLGRIAAAIASAEEAVAVRQALGNPTLLAESQAVLAGACFAGGDRERALQAIADPCAALEGGAKMTLRIQLTCSRIVRDADPERAARILAAARAELLEQAAQLPAEADRAAFLKIPWHQEILGAAEQAG